MQGLDSNVKGEVHDDIAPARANAAPLAELVRDYKNMALEDYISASNALNNYLDPVQGLSRAQQFMVQKQTTIEQALEELKDIPPNID